MVTDKYRMPGQYIKALLSDRQWTQRVLAIILAVDDSVIGDLISGRRVVSAELALLLGEAFDVPAEDFLALQRDYDLAKARIESIPDPDRANRAKIFGALPIAEMIKRGWIDANDIRDVPQVESSLAKFFGVSSTEEIEVLPHAAKKTETFRPVTPAQLAWIYRVRAIAKEMVVPRYSPDMVAKAVPLLSSLRTAPEEARKVPRILAEAGIRFVLVESLASTKIDGVCMWLDDASPVIALTMRFDRIDNFFFVLRHEVEHVIRLDGRDTIMLDTELQGERAGTGPNVADEERIANRAAAEFCVPSPLLEKFHQRKAPFFNERDILGFANTIGVHPGIVAGQLQHKTGLYDRFRQHLVKIRSNVAPSAMVDGWGDIAPVG